MAIDKLKIARSFSRAAVNYDNAAHLQREIGETLLAKLQAQFTSSELGSIDALVDLGCGTGHFAHYLQSLYPQAAYVGTDIAKGMLDYANDHYSSLYWLCADAEQLPFGNDTIDCLFSNLTLQWCSNLAALFDELMRILKPGGQICFSTLGPATLSELREAWRQVDHLVHVNDFYSNSYWITAIEDAGLKVHTHSTELKVLRYDTVSQLMHELKTLGAHNMNTSQRQALGGRRQIQLFSQAYESFRTQGKLPVTYEVYYFLLYKPLIAVDAI